MATKPPLLEIETLIGEIPGDFEGGLKGAGDPNFYDNTLRAELNELREEVLPGMVDKLGQPRPIKNPEWKKVEEQAKEALGRKSKDLRVAAYLAEALAKQNGFAGVRDGLALMRRLCETCWDRLYPPIEDGDLMSRMDPVLNLIDSDRGLEFPITLRKLPLIQLKDKTKGSYGTRDHELAQDSKRPEAKNLEVINQAMLATPYEFVQGELEAITASIAERDQLVKLLQAKMGNKGPAPGFVQINESLGKCKTLAEFVAKKVAPPPPIPGPETDKPGEPGAKTAPKPVVPTRQGIYDQLQALANQLKALEPHSPIPFLIDRCVKLGKMAFPEMIKELVREQKVLEEMNRELDIKAATPGPAKK